MLVYIPVTVGCGCRMFFGPTHDNAFSQPLRERCKHGRLWSGTFLPKTREAIVGEIVAKRVNEVSYAVEPIDFEKMYEEKEKERCSKY